jgi:oligopeptide/dipeptide ABC transporter ATP-binding protein
VLYRGRVVEDAPADRFFSEGARHPYSQELLTSAFAARRYLQRLGGPLNEPLDAGGCPYRHRCLRVSVEPGGPCVTMTPPVFHLQSDHRVACHKWQNS